ncbi:MAG: hypothetical protein HUU43_01585 [Ignavibacteriaceae bacterium]|nr:hypothetical protein [Ignavibacteriaceae bacterium]NUM69513.1 hypothetical protein [Ignavibacteriaceae bacterium]
MKVLLLFTLVMIINLTGYSQIDSSLFPGEPPLDSAAFMKLYHQAGEEESDFWGDVLDQVRISGEFGAFGELYGISGKESRRPGQTGRIYFRPTISLFNNFSVNFDLFLSTEGSAARQNINTIALHPAWGWGVAHIGDFTHQMSRFTLSDVMVRGGGLELYPGILRFQLIAGQTQRATELGAFNSTYSRYVVAGKLGIGDGGGDHIDINILRSRDDQNSLNRMIFQQIDSIPGSGGSLRADTSYVGVTPEENLIMGVNWGLNLFENSLKIKSELSASLFTKDMYSDEIDSKDVPEFMRDVFTPRITTNADYALHTELGYNSQLGNARLAYTIVGPGYTSLGIASILNDRQIINGSLSFNVLSGLITVQTNYQRQNDNIIQQKLFTTVRDNYGFVLAVRPLRSLSITVNTNFNSMLNDANNDTIKVDNGGYNVGANINYQLDAFGFSHSLNTNITTQTFATKSRIRGDNEVNSQGYNFGITTNFSKQLSTNLTASLNTVDLGPRGNNNSQTVNARVNYKMLDDKLNNSLSYAFTNSDASATSVIVIQSNYPLFTGSTVGVMFRGSFFSGKGNNSNTFSEYTGSFTWSYRF